MEILASNRTPSGLSAAIDSASDDVLERGLVERPSRLPCSLFQSGMEPRFVPGSRIPRRPMIGTRRSLGWGVAMLAIAVALGAFQAQAIPRYSARYGQTCALCHV